jgi:hypothetical protein
LKRIALSLCICGLASAAVTPAAFGFSASFDYTGTVRGQATSSVGFSIERSATGHKRVTEFTVVGVDYTCNDAPPGQTGGWMLDRVLRVKARKFDGKGDWTGLPFDPVGRVSGKLKPGGRASGSFKLTGELGGPGTHCRTGLVDWTASKLPF